MLKLITLVGIFLFPEITIGALLIHYNHELLGMIALAYGILKSAVKD